MADGTLTIKINMDSASASKESQRLKESLAQIGQTGATSSKKGIASILGMGTAFGVASKAGAVAFNAVKNSIGSAVSRVDTMKAFPRMMESWGYSAGDSRKAINKLAEGIDGLPTTLDSVTGIAQQLTMLNGDLDKSTDLTIALNNAFLASGSSSAEASRGMVQFQQMMAKGKVDMQSWNSLVETMPVGLDAVAKSMLGANANQKDLYDAIKNGVITFDQFSDKLIELNDGVGGFAEMARINSEGIGTSMQNLGSAVTRGVANVIQAFDDLSVTVTGKSIAQHLDSFKEVINSTFNKVTGIIRQSTPVVQFFFDVIKSGMPIAQALTPALVAMAGAYAGLTVVKQVTTFTQALTTALKLKNVTLTMVTTMMKMNTAAEIANVAAVLKTKGVLSASTLIYGVLNNTIEVGTAIKLAAAGATTALKAALTALAGPVGWVVAGVTALVGAGIALFAWFNRDSEVVKQLKGEQEKLTNATSQLTSEIDSNIASRKGALDGIKSESQQTKKLYNEIKELAKQEKLSAGQKQILKDKIAQLNAELGTEAVKYDEATGKLEANNAEIEKRLSYTEAQKTYTEASQQLTAVQQELAEVEKQLAENEANMNALREEGKKPTKEMTEANDELKAKVSELSDEEQRLAGVVAETASQVAGSMAEMGESMSLTFADLTESQQSFVESYTAQFQALEEKTTSVFDRIQEKERMSFEEMQANLLHNAEVVANWSSNLKELATRGVDQGILEQLRRMGPEGAQYAAELNARSDEELKGLSEQFQTNTQTAVDAMGNVLDSSGTTLSESVKGMITQTGETLATEIETVNFASIGQEIPNGLKEGIEANAGQPAQSSTDMARKVDEAARNELGVRSPSRKFIEIGKFVVEGLKKGVSDSQDQAVSAMKKLGEALNKEGQTILNRMKQLAGQIPQQFSSLSGEMHNVGAHAMSGLANGINANAGVALAAADNVANQVTARIRSALDIHSPSRVMRDQVGKWIPLGVADGIERNSQPIFDNLDAISEKMSRYKLSVEELFGTGSSTLNGQLEVKNTTESSLKRRIEIVQQKADETLQYALQVAETAMRRPVYLNVDGHEFAQTVGDTVTKFQERKLRLTNRMKGVVDG